MTQVTIRELTHGFSKYLRAVKRGEKIVILKRRTPVADLIPHNENLAQPGWKRPITRIKVKGEPFSETVSKMRDEER
jgi:antitoxin (DNA-binding transcriptional repressor) of toxin-antitoxin stability system